MFIPGRRTKVTTLVGLACLAAVVLGAALPEHQTPLSRAQFDAETWVAAHKAALPSTLAELGPLPMVTRREVLSHLTVTEKERVWREQLQTFVTPLEKLTALQQAMIQGLSAPLNEEQTRMIGGVLDSLGANYGEGTTVEQRAAYAKRVCVSAQKTFPANDARLIFATLGPVDTTYSRLVSDTRAQEAGLLAWSTHVVRYATEKAGLRPKSRSEICFCHQDGCAACDGCPIGRCCVQSWPPCEGPIENNCGCLGGQPCDGGKCTG